ncbi:MAG TPA: hypothetical protein VGG29_15995, partial [Caulobacteraceae bacterium]
PCYRLDSNALLQAAATIGMIKPTLEDHRAAQALAERLMNHKVVGIETLRAVQAVQPAASLVFKEAGVVTGVAGQLMLRRSAIAAFFEDRFSATDVDLDLLSRDGEMIAVGYGWGVAASTPTARAAMNAFGQLMRCELFPLMATFARAVTDVGRHVSIARYHYRPFRHPDDDLILRLPCVEQQAASDAARASKLQAVLREPVAA